MREINRTGTDAKPDSPVGQIVEFAQDRQHVISESAITTSTIGEREVKFELVGGVMKIIFKFDGTLYKWTAD